MLMFILATIGLTNILVHGKILDLIKIEGKSIRQWMHNTPWSEELFSCYECTGFWAGLVCGLVLFPWWLCFMCAFAGSVLSQTYTDILYLIRSKVEFEVPDETRED